MSFTSREIEASSAAVWAVVIDPFTYPSWLIGAQEIRDVDDDWPCPGSAFRHRVGFGPLTIPDSTKVIAVDSGRRLRLAVRARPLVSAVATITLVSDGTHTVVSMEEEPDFGALGELVRPLLDPSTHVRNHRSLCRLEEVVRHGPVSPGAAPDNVGR